MTKQKHLKRRIRARMAQTGERYTTARRHIVGSSAVSGSDAAPPAPGQLHFPGIHPETTALRILLANADVRAPHTGEYFTEPMVFGIGGGIGAGGLQLLLRGARLCELLHRRTPPVAGQPHLSGPGRAAVRRDTHIQGNRRRPKTAAKQLGDALAAGGPVLAWVASAHLPYRGLPDYWSGGDYHVVTVYRLDETGALIGDLLDDPVEITAAELATSRARIKEQKHRIMTVAPTEQLDLRAAVGAGIRACYEGLAQQRIKNFTLDAFKTWAGNIHGSRGKQSWARALPARPSPLVRAHVGLRLYRAPAHRRRATAAAVCRLLCRSCRRAARRRAAPARRTLRRARAGVERHRERRVAGTTRQRAARPRELMARKEALLLTEGGRGNRRDQTYLDPPRRATGSSAIRLPPYGDGLRALAVRSPAAHSPGLRSGVRGARGTGRVRWRIENRQPARDRVVGP